jgi:RHS repeat-associated protein
MQDPNKGTWLYAYDLGGNLVSQTDARGQTITLTYDALGRLTRKRYPSGQELAWTYDDPAVPYARGRLTRVDDLATVTRFAYDRLGRVTQTQRTLDATTYVMSQTYDAMDRVTSRTFPDGETVTYLFNDAGWLQSVPGYVTAITYNARGQVVSEQAANGITTTSTYDPVSLRPVRKRAGAGHASGTASLLALQEWSRAWTTSATVVVPPPAGYGLLHRGGLCLMNGGGTCAGGDVTIDSGPGAAVGYYSTTSDATTVALYRATCYANGAGTCTQHGLTLAPNGVPVGHLATSAPDAASAAAPFTQSGGLLLQGLGVGDAFAWTASFTTVVTNHTDHVYVLGTTPVEGYTAGPTVGYVHQHADGGASVPLQRYVNTVTGHHYYSTAADAPAGFTSEATLGYLHPNAGAGLTALYRDYHPGTFDYRLTAAASPASGYERQATLGYLHATVGTGEPIDLPLPHVQDLAYTYDANGNILAITDSVGTASRTFTYDALNRLTSASGTFGPLSGGLPASVSEAYQFDPLGNLTSKAGIAYAYSDPAHPSAVTATSDGRAYTYDANGNMLTGAGRALAWDADNRLSAVTTQGGNSAELAYDYTGRRVRKTVNAASVIRYPFPGYEIASDGVITKFVAGHAKRSTGERLFYHTDHLGGTHVITDITGLRVQLVEYDPWGKVVRSEGTADTTHGFTGQFLDPESGLMYYGGRYYDPVLGRFISPDPFVQSLTNPQTLNRYAYVLNNPVNRIDPTGYFSLGKFFKFIAPIIVAIVVAIVVPEILPAIAATFGTTLTPAVTGAVAGAAAGAAASATNVVLNKAPPLSILTGTALGAVGGAAAPGLNGALVGATKSALVGAVGTGAILGGSLGGVNAAVSGGDVGVGILMGAALGAVGGAVSHGLSSAADSVLGAMTFGDGQNDVGVIPFARLVAGLRFLGLRGVEWVTSGTCGYDGTVRSPAACR